jgi:hypothetical protein
MARKPPVKGQLKGVAPRPGHRPQSLTQAGSAAQQVIVIFDGPEP